MLYVMDSTVGATVGEQIKLFAVMSMFALIEAYLSGSDQLHFELLHDWAGSPNDVPVSPLCTTTVGPRFQVPVALLLLPFFHASKSSSQADIRDRAEAHPLQG